MSTDSPHIANEIKRRRREIQAKLIGDIREALSTPAARRFYTWIHEVQCLMPTRAPPVNLERFAGRRDVACDIDDFIRKHAPELEEHLDADRRAFWADQRAFDKLLAKQAEDRPGAAPPEPPEPKE